MPYKHTRQALSSLVDATAFYPPRDYHDDFPLLSIFVLPADSHSPNSFKRTGVKLTDVVDEGIQQEIAERMGEWREIPQRSLN